MGETAKEFNFRFDKSLSKLKSTHKTDLFFLLLLLCRTTRSVWHSHHVHSQQVDDLRRKTRTCVDSPFRVLKCLLFVDSCNFSTDSYLFVSILINVVLSLM